MLLLQARPSGPPRIEYGLFCPSFELFVRTIGPFYSIFDLDPEALLLNPCGPPIQGSVAREPVQFWLLDNGVLRAVVVVMEA